jgi:hypothetical protein
MREFGIICYVHIPDVKRRKWDQKGEKAMFLGYDDCSTGYRLLILSTLKVVISDEVQFEEGSICYEPEKLAILPPFPFAAEPIATAETEQFVQTVFERPVAESIVEPPIAPPFAIQPPVVPQFVAEPIVEPPVAPLFAIQPPAEPMPPVEQQNEGIGGVAHDQHQDDQMEGDVATCANRHYPLRLRKPKVIQSMNAMDFEDDLFEPGSFLEAMGCRKTYLWQPSVQDEFDSLIKNGTWILVHLPPGRTAIGTRWVFKIKPGHGDIPPRYKSRFVAKGYAQVEGVDYNEFATYAPVVGYCSLRAVLSLCAALDLEMSQLDIKTAFLYGEIDEEMYIEQPEGFVVKGKEHLVCLLLKCIYGLKQAPHVWNEKFNSFLILFGFTRSKHDPCVYFRRKETEILIMAIWVDDGLICSNNKTSIAEVLAYLSTHFEMRSLPTDRFVGLQLTRNRGKRNFGSARMILSRKLFFDLICLIVTPNLHPQIHMFVYQRRWSLKPRPKEERPRSCPTNKSSAASTTWPKPQDWTLRLLPISFLATQTTGERSTGEQPDIVSPTSRERPTTDFVTGETVQMPTRHHSVSLTRTTPVTSTTFGQQPATYCTTTMAP